MSRFVLTAQLQLQAPNNVAQVVRQIQSQLNNVTVNVQVQNAAQAQRQLQQVTAQTTAATTAADRMGRAFAISIRRFAAFSIATRAVGLFTSTLSDAIRTAIDFERQMIKVSQVTGESMEKLKGLTRGITDLSTSLGVPSQDLLEVSTLLLQAGVSARDTEVALKTLAKAALAPNFDSISETAEGAIAILAQFQEGVGALEKQLGSINAVAGAFAVEAGDLIDVIRRTGGVFKSSGGSLNELLALFTSVRATTRESAESIGTGLRTIFTRIQRPKTIEFLKQFGVELVDLEGKFVGPFEAVRRLSDALVGLGEGDITFIRIAEELGGFRQIGKVLPLLQQFSTAQEALNVANKAGSSLTNDAATAQAALAVRIVKVKEEFLALIRGITETKTFQIMASTALAFASALIKIGEAIKPLLPLLATLAAVNLVKGLGSFAGGFMRGASSGRTYSTGGTVKKFARGGLVPGQGNRDTVPAMLMPGEFVIKKSSVNKLGANNLAAMNENRYENGGKLSTMATAKSAIVGKRKLTGLEMQKAARRAGYDIERRDDGLIELSRNGRTMHVLTDDQASKLLGSMMTGYAIGGIVGGVGLTPSDQSMKGSGKVSVKDIIESLTKNSNLPGGISGNKDVFLGKESSKLAQQVISRVGGFSASTPSSSRSFTAIGQSFKDADLNRQIGDDVEKGMSTLIGNAAAVLGSSIGVAVTGSPNSGLIKSIGSTDVMGKIFEGALNLLGAPFDPLAAKQDRDSFDFPSGLGGALGSYFKGFENIPVDAKKSLNTDILNDIATRKTKNFIAGQVNIDPQFQQLKNSKLAAKASTKKKFASGGSSGTDTVPALLTPGEFVVNRSSAQRIGYGNLNRMNKVGKYAKGGVVQHFSNGSSGPIAPLNPPPVPPSNGANALVAAWSQSTKAITNNTQAQNESSKSIKDVIANNKLFAASILSSLIQGFFPAIDENSSGLMIFSQSLLNSVTVILGTLTALEAFGVTLSKNSIAAAIDSISGAFNKGLVASISSLFSQTAATVAQTTSTTAQTVATTTNTAAITANTAANSGASAGATKLAGGLQAGLAAAAAVTVGFYSLVQAIKETARLEKERAIKLGDVEGAGNAAATEAGSGVRQTFGTIGSAIGGLIGTIGGAFVGNVPGAIAGGAAGATGGAGAGLAVAEFLGYTLTAADAARLQAEVAAQTTVAQKAVAESSTKAAQAMEQFRNGSISAQEALAASLGGTQEANALVQKTRDANAKAAKAAEENWYWTNAGREAAKKKAQQEGELRTQEARKLAEQQVASLQPALQANMRQTAAQGGSYEDFENSLDTATVELLNSLPNGIENTYKAFENIRKEIDRARAAFEAMNLGLRGAEGTASAMSATMSKFAAGLEVGGNSFVANAEFLASAMSSAAQAMNPDEIKSAIKGVRDNLENMGVSPQYLAKFEANTQAFVQAQQNYNKAFEKIRVDIQRRRGRGESVDTSPEAMKKAFAEELTAGLGGEAKDNLTKIIMGMKLDEGEVEAILGGNMEIFGQKLSEAGQKQYETIIKIAQERQKAEQILIGFIQKRIEAERNFVEAQKEAVDMLMEGREIQGKYGGRAVSQDERRAAIVAKANANRAGIPNLKTGSVAELRARNAQIAGRAFGIETDRRVQGGMSGTRGVERDATQQDLIKAQKDQAQTIRDMIKLEEESLRIIQEKNKLEKDSMQSLISGDIEKFFEQQSAVGAQAALAAGDRDLANQFGAKAVGEAFMDITRQMEAGVQELFGRQLAGPGGLAEQSAQAALASRGIMDPRMAQMMAGTTPEEQEVKQRLQELGGLLGETGAWMQALSEMQVQTAQINVANAQVELSQIEQRGRDVANGMYRGGMVYASRGMFVPRGTDTVPAMLTPGEFVVRRESVNRGNNLQLLKAINNGSGSTGYARGGKVGYYREGGLASGGIGGLLQSAANVLGINTQLITDLSNTFVKFNTQFQESIKNLQNTRLHLTMDSVNVNVNINGGFMNQVSGEAKNEIMKQVVNEIKNKYRIGNNGNIVEKTGNLPTPGQGS